MTLSAMLQSRICNHVALTSQYVTQILRTTDICHTVTYSAPFSVLPFSLFSRKSLNSFLFHFKSSFFFSPLFAIPVLIAMHPSLLFSVHPNYLPRTCTCECPVPTKKTFLLPLLPKQFLWRAFSPPISFERSPHTNIVKAVCAAILSIIVCIVRGLIDYC